MTLMQIQYFLEVCKTLNFTKAARNLYVAQPSFSRQIQMLETELGVQLLIRSNRNVILTEAGRVFKDEFDIIEQDILNAVNKVKSDGNLKKEISVGLFLGLNPKSVVDLIDKLNSYFVSYKIYVNKYSSYNLKRAFELGNVDLVVSLFQIGADSIETESCDILELPVFLVYSPRLFANGKKPQSVQDFDGMRFICTKDSEAGRLVEHQLAIIKTLGIHPSEIIRTDDIISTLLYTEGRSGFSVYINSTPDCLLAYPVPNSSIRLKVSSYWKKDAKIPFNQFFREEYLQ